MSKISNISIPANRFKAMLQMIPRAPDSISTERLQERLFAAGFEVDLRTVQRNLKDLVVSGEFGLNSEKKGRESARWQYLADAPVTIFPSLDDHTALAFRLADAFLQSLMPPETVHALRPFVDEAGRHLAKRRQAAAGKWQDKIHVFPRGLRRKSPPIAKEIRDTVYRALLDEKALHISYATPGRPVPNEFTISPLGLIIRDYLLYLIGLPVEQYERSEKQILSFALHRIRAIETPEAVKFLRPADFSLADHEDSLGKPRKGESNYYDLVIRIGARTLVSMRECPLVERQTLEKDASDPEGRTLLRARVPNTEELRQWIRSLGPNAEVIEPKSLRADMAEEFATLARRYAPPTSAMV
ncbi:helix-turn-helix transcriptional regulator [Quatrionicoccus australiensis]|uniref:helix-turn-helix transcriptional regulator n=1 Tax=Quatrionicoccus australiensis TaxID=138118 RepID=UPI001CF88BFF|nr:WYL domain-containing protein [Quatrionicoccus australiensis]UCV16675.1 WYL domain-containing protein [Quatrionicoccus australiensis]